MMSESIAEIAAIFKNYRPNYRPNRTNRTDRTDGGEAAGRTGWGNDVYAMAEITGIFKNSRPNRTDRTDMPQLNHLPDFIALQMSELVYDATVKTNRFSRIGWDNDVHSMEEITGDLQELPAK